MLIDKQAIAQAADCLKRGLTVAMPTETVYGLAANALDTRAVARIFEIKNRPHFDPLIVHVRSLEAASPFVKEIPALVKQIYSQLGSGPITYLMSKSARIPDLVTAGHTTVAIRIPAHPMAQALLKTIDFPLAAPSANPFGFTSPTTAAHVASQLGTQICYLLDGGPCEVGLESTIIDATAPGLRVLRLGGLSLELLEKAAGMAVTELQTSSSNPSAPGMLSQHYNPGKTVYFGDEASLVKQFSGSRTGVLAFDKLVEGISPENQRLLAPDGRMETAAARLFGLLRELGQLPVDQIICFPLPDTGLGRAINDRLQRAAARPLH